MNAADRLDSIDARLERLVAVSEEQAETARQQARNIERLADTAERQAKTIEGLVSAVSELSRTNAAINQDRNALLESAQRATQASEAAQMLAQSNQVAIRDLIEELRQGRGA
jgi:uncharacterized protein YoxC